MSEKSQNLTITVLDTATIYEGLESIFRYDLPGSGVVEGWALAGVMEQAQKSAGTGWPEVPVKVLADPTSTQVSEDAVAIIARQLRLAGVVTQVEDPPVAHPPAADPLPVAAVPLSQPLATRSADQSGKKPVSKVVVAAGVGVAAVAVVAGLVWWPKAESVDLEYPVQSMAAIPQPDSLPQESGGITEHVSTAKMEFDLPPGFSWSEADGVTTAVGKDPNLRIVLTADPTFSVPGEEIREVLRTQVTSDPTLSSPQDVNGRFTYVEKPSDGSLVTWTTWIDGDYFFSVGCHSKNSQTVVQKAACQLVAKSLVARAPETKPAE